MPLQQTSSGPCNLAILLCTMQGGNFLEEQLASIAAQTVSGWKVWASDDGSQDSTVAILEAHRQAWGAERLAISKGPGKGFVANFLSLAARKDIQANYYAYADQDDIWEPDKLRRALDWLVTIPAHVPALYCGRTRLISEAGHEIGFSPLFTRAPSFANALVQSISGGNTMVFNRAAHMLLAEAGAQVDVVSHDWWTYLLVSACGGVVRYDPYPMVRYRQHDNNLIGSNGSLSARLKRMRLLGTGRFRNWNNRHLEALKGMRCRMPEKNLRILDTFAAARQQGAFVRLAGLRRAGVYRQTAMDNLMLFMAASFGKV